MDRSSSTATVALIRDTFREAFARKIIWGFFGCSTMIILFFLFLMKIDVVEGALATVSLFGNETPARDVLRLVRELEGGLAAFLYGFGIVPGRLRVRRPDPFHLRAGQDRTSLLSKPVSRSHILLGRYVGNLLVIACNILYLVAPVWLILAIKTGIWTGNFFYSTALTVFAFAVLLALVVLVSVLWESAALATMVTFGVMILGLVVAQKSTIERPPDVGMVAERGSRALLHAAEDMGFGENRKKAGDRLAHRGLGAAVELRPVRSRDAESRSVSLRAAELLMRISLGALLVMIVGCGSADMGAMRIDPVLAALVPNDAIMVAGLRVRELRTTPLYTKLVAQKRLPELDEDFVKNTHFDPRKDMNDVLIASDGTADGGISSRDFQRAGPRGRGEVGLQGCDDLRLERRSLRAHRWLDSGRRS